MSENILNNKDKLSSQLSTPQIKIPTIGFIGIVMVGLVMIGTSIIINAGIGAIMLFTVYAIALIQSLRNAINQKEGNALIPALIAIVFTSAITGAGIGAIVGLGLSFTTLSPLVIGGIVGAIPAVLSFALGCYMLYHLQEKLGKKTIASGCACVIASTVIGVSCAAVFGSEMMLSTSPAILIGAAIGAISLAAAILVGTLVIDPIINKVIKCMSKSENPKSKVCEVDKPEINQPKTDERESETNGADPIMFFPSW